jgi:hypothetical protein
MNQIFKDKANEIIESIIKIQKRSEPGSLPWLFWGDKISEQSFYIKVGRNFEKWFKFIAENSEGFELLPDGITKEVSNGESKDIDFIIVNKSENIIYYYELKSNAELDTEKLPVTIDKVKVITEYLTSKYPQYQIESGILHWSVYNKNILSKKYFNKFKKAEASGVNVIHPTNLFDILKQNISEKDYYTMFRDITKTYLLG